MPEVAGWDITVVGVLWVLIVVVIVVFVLIDWVLIVVRVMTVVVLVVIDVGIVPLAIIVVLVVVGGLNSNSNCAKGGDEFQHCLILSIIKTRKLFQFISTCSRFLTEIS